MTVLKDIAEYELIFIDDGSTDETLLKIKELAEKYFHITYLSFSRNFGHQIALKAGLDIAKGEAVIMMDADMQHPPQLIPKLIKRWQQGYEIVNTIRKTDENLSFVKRKTSNIVALITFSFILIITIVLYYQNKLIGYDKNKDTAKILKQEYLEYVNLIPVKLNDSLRFVDTNNKSHNTKDITKTRRWGIYIDKERQCSPCIDSALYVIQNHFHLDVDDNMSPFVLTKKDDCISCNSLRLMKILENDTYMKVYTIDLEQAPILKFLAEQANKPFYFVLEANGCLTSIFFYDEKLNDIIGDDYWDANKLD